MPDVVHQTDDVIKEVFLSPRVIDREAFNDYAAGLRKLIEDAASNADALRAAAVDAQQAQNALRETAARHQPKLEAAGRTLATIDSRLADADRLSSLASNAEGQLASVREQIENLISGRLAEVGQQTERMIRQAEEQAAAIRQQAQADAQRAIEQASSRARQISEDAVASAERRLALIERQAGERVQAFISEQVDDQLMSRTRELEARVNDLTGRELPSFDFAQAQRAAELVEGAVSRAQHLLSDAATRAEKLGVTTGAKVDQLQSLTEQACLVRDLLGKAIEEATGQVDELLDRADGVKDVAAAIAPACARAEERVGNTLRQMEISVETARTVVGDAGAMVSRLGVLVEQLKPWGPMLLTREGEELPPVLQDAVERACGRIRSEAAEISGALMDVSSRMSRYSSQIARPGSSPT